MTAKKADKSGGGFVDSMLAWIERIGNKLPDPAILFLVLLVLTWLVSAVLAPIEFADEHPATGEPIRVVNQLTGTSLTTFLSVMVTTFTSFPPLGLVLVALLGVGVAEHQVDDLQAPPTPADVDLGPSLGHGVDEGAEPLALAER